MYFEGRRRIMGRKKIKCIFCSGTGLDPFDLLSNSSTCQVCNGRKNVELAEPVIKCVFCKGTGVYPGKRITCTVCFGKGAVFAKPDMKAKCPDCRGSGAAPDSGLPCLKCKGRGVK